MSAKRERKTRESDRFLNNAGTKNNEHNAEHYARRGRPRRACEIIFFIKIVSVQCLEYLLNMNIHGT